MAISAAARLEARRALEPLPLLEGVQDDGTINKTLFDYVWRKPGKGWLLLTGKPEDIDAVLRIYRIKRERESDGTIAHVATSFLVGADGKQMRTYNAMEVAPNTVVGDIEHALANG